MYKNYFRKNLDAYYFAVDAYLEFPGIKEKDIKQLIYDEFGFERFSKNTFMVIMLIRVAKTHSKTLMEIYA